MSRRRNSRHFIRQVLFSALVIMFISGNSGAADYEYAGMWPVLQQPWHFGWPEGVAVDTKGNVYVANTWAYEVFKMTSDGKFINKWGHIGSGEGQFYLPGAVATDLHDDVFVADTGNNRIQKFSANGDFITAWGRYGSGNGEFNSPAAIATDTAGNVYVADTGNHRVQKFSSGGQFIRTWGSYGSAAGDFISPAGIASDNGGHIYVADKGNWRIQKFSNDGSPLSSIVSPEFGGGSFMGISVDSSGNIYVADSLMNRILKFSADGTLVNQWGRPGRERNEFNEPSSIAVDRTGNIYVSEFRNFRIQKMNADGTSVALWQGHGSMDGYFADPTGLAKDTLGNLYVADCGNNRVQVFDSGRRLLRTWQLAGNARYLNAPCNLAIDKDGKVYVSDPVYSRVQIFNPDGTPSSLWGEWGVGPGQMSGPEGIAVDLLGDVYIAEADNNRVQVFSGGGAYKRHWGGKGSGPGQFDHAGGILIDESKGLVYVTDLNNHRVQVFDKAGTYKGEWGSHGFGEGEFQWPYALAFDNSGNIIVGDWSRVQVFTPGRDFLTQFGWFGSDAAQFGYVGGLAVAGDGTLYVTDHGNSRVQFFRPAPTSGGRKLTKAVIVAGGGNFEGNSLWDPAQLNASFAYRALNMQGIPSEAIHYLSSNTALDLNNDGASDIAADATNDNLKYELTHWAKDADSVILYMVDHGGSGTFKISRSETLSAADLGGWLDELQTTIPGRVIVVYDACESGSFVSALYPPSGNKRIIITSASPSEYAYFLNTGMTSFSFFFWSKILSGASLRDAFSAASASVGMLRGANSDQNPMFVTSEGNAHADDIYLGLGIDQGKGIPIIGAITQGRVLHGESSSAIMADDITSSGYISRVWAAVKGPEFANASDKPVTAIPTVELRLAEGGRYEGTYAGFIATGTYAITVYAMDDSGVLSLPMATSVLQTNGQSGAAETRDLFEPDDSAGQASIINVSDEQPQYHDFGRPADEDWVKFFALAGEDYVVEIRNPGSTCRAVIEAYVADGATLLDRRMGSAAGMPVKLNLRMAADGILYVRVRNSEGGVSGPETGYDLMVYRPIAPPVRGALTGKITDAVTGEPVKGAVMRSNHGETAVSNARGDYVLLAFQEALTLTVSAAGYSDSVQNASIRSSMTVVMNVMFQPARNACAATLSADLVLHLPVIRLEDSQAYYWADLSYMQNTSDFTVTGAGVVADASPFDGCTPTTLTADSTLHVPAITFGNSSYWADLLHSGGLIFMVTGAGQN